MIFDEDDVLYNLVEFESDRMSPRESAKNGRIGAHGLNWKNFVNSEWGHSGSPVSVGTQMRASPADTEFTC